MIYAGIALLAAQTLLGTGTVFEGPLLDVAASSDLARVRDLLRNGPEESPTAAGARPVERQP